MLGRIIVALLALIGLAALALGGAYMALKRADIPYETLAAHYETSASRYEALESGVRVHYLDAGDPNAATLILLHGYTSSSATWTPWIERLGDAYHIIAVDLPGHGLTSAPAGYEATIEHFRDTLGEFVRARGLNRFALAGNSMGGNVAWEYALAYPEQVEALILVDASGWPVEEPALQENQPILEALSHPTIGPIVRDLDNTQMMRQGLEFAFADDSLVTDAMVERYAELSRAPGHRAMMLDLMLEFTQRRFASPEVLADLTAPTLIVWGDQDEVVPVADAQKFKDAIPGARLVMFEGVGHMPHEEAPDQSAAAVRTFLEANLSAPAPALEELP